MYVVYILRSLKNKKFYIGCTVDLERRLREHNQGKTPSLKHRRPLEIIYTEQYDNPEAAYAREKQIKRYKSGIAFQKLIGGVA